MTRALTRLGRARGFTVDIGTMRNVRPVHQRTPSASEHELVMGAATPVGRPPGRRTSLSSWRSSPSARNQPPDRPTARGRGGQLHPKRTQAGTMSRAGPRAAAVVAAHHPCSWLPPGWVLKSKSILRHRLDPSRGGSGRRCDWARRVSKRCLAVIRRKTVPRAAGRMSRVPWNFSSGPMIIRLRSRSHHAGRY